MWQPWLAGDDCFGGADRESAIITALDSELLGSRHGAWQKGLPEGYVHCDHPNCPQAVSATSRLYLILLCNKSIWVSCQSKLLPVEQCVCSLLLDEEPHGQPGSLLTGDVRGKATTQSGDADASPNARSHPSPCSLMMVSLPPVSSVHIRSFQYFCKGQYKS